MFANYISVYWAGRNVNHAVASLIKVEGSLNISFDPLKSMEICSFHL
jgi:hypothetical protein